MEKQKVVKKRKKKADDTCLITELENQSIICGWQNIDECAATLWNGIHNTLLEGILLFGYRDVSRKSDLIQLVVVRNIHPETLEKYGDKVFSVGIIKKGWTGITSMVDIDYLKTITTNDLQEAPREVQEAWNKILEKL